MAIVAEAIVTTDLTFLKNIIKDGIFLPLSSSLALNSFYNSSYGSFEKFNLLGKNMRTKNPQASMSPEKTKKVFENFKCLYKIEPITGPLIRPKPQAD